MKENLRLAEAAVPVFGDAALKKAAEISAAIEVAVSALADALRNEQEAERRKLYASFGSIRVDGEAFDKANTGNLLRTLFTIHWTREAYDTRTRSSYMQPHSMKGFDSLPNEVMDYLIHAKPEAIPASILALAPGDPLKAFQRYFTAKRKGYLSASALAA